MVKGVEAYVKSITELRSEFWGRMMEAIQKVVDFEVSAMREAIDNPGFNKWLDQFYPVEHNLKSGERFIEYVTLHMGPVIREYMRRMQWPAVHTLLDEELPVSMLDDFIEVYIRDYALRHGSSSRRQTLAVMEETKVEAEGKSLRVEEVFESPAQAARVRWREWTMSRAGTTATDEVVRQGNAVSREAWSKSGVTKLRWRTRGDSCPLCNKLNGKVVGIDRPFLEDGEVLTAEYEKAKPVPALLPGIGDTKLKEFPSAFEREKHEKIVGKELDRLRKKYPKIKGVQDGRPLRGLTITGESQLRDTTGIGLYDPNKNTIELATKNLPTNPNLVIGGNTYLVGADTGSAFRHEFGHYIYYQGSPVYGGVERKWRPLVKGKKKKGLISSYAQTNNQESFAEAFSAYTSPLYGKAARRLPQDMEDFMKDFLGG